MSRPRTGPNICLILVPLLNICGSDSYLNQFLNILEPISNYIYVIVDGCSSKNYENRKIKILGNQIGWRLTNNIMSRILRYILSQIKIIRYIYYINRNCNIIIFYSGTQLYFIPIILFSLIGKRLILVHQGSLSNSFKCQYTGKIGSIFSALIDGFEKLSFSIVDLIIVESQNVIDFSGMNKYSNKIIIGDYNYIDTNLYNITQPFNEREPLVAYIGQFLEVKGVLNFCQSVPLILKRMNVKIIMVGKIGDSTLVEDELMAVACLDRVKIMGRIPPENIPRLLNEIKLLVVPSFSEGLPGIIRQAMACGTPVLATSVGGIPDIIVDGSSGFIMDDNSPESIAENVNRFFEFDDIDRVIINARKIIQSRFGLSSAVNRWETILNSVD